MDPADAGVIGAITAAAVGLTKAVETAAKKLGSDKDKQRLDKIESLVAELHRWHDVRDPETGAPLWYDKTRSVSDILMRLEHSVERLADVFEKVKDNIRHRN